MSDVGNGHVGQRLPELRRRRIIGFMSRISGKPSGGVDRRRKLGQVFTPQPVAEWMARWVCAGRPRSVLDPAVGPGVFIKSLKDVAAAERWREMPRVDVCDVDGELLRQCADAHAGGGWPIRSWNVDFVTAAFDEPYEAIIANPPYVCHRELDYDAEVMRTFDRLCGRRLSRMTNLYGLFLIKIWTLLARGGRAAVITPAEWLNADFGTAIKAYLLEENAIEAIVHFDHAASVFDGALTTAAITLLRRGREAGAPVRLWCVPDVERLGATVPSEGRAAKASELDPGKKWTPLFAAGVPRAAGASPAPRTLGDVARCSRGIATGANDYFTLRESELGRWGIDRRDVRFCITKAQHVAGETLTEVDVARLVKEDQRIYLLCPRTPLAEAVELYLAEGRRRGIDRRYLPSHRPVWYVPERRDPPPILVGVFARGDFRFVLNEARVLHLTAFHGIYPRRPDVTVVQALFDYLMSGDGGSAVRQHMRIYGDGLSKVEPRDIEALPIPESLCGAG